MENLQFNELENGGEMTLEQLAAMVARGFYRVDKRFDRIENLLIAKAPYAY